MTAEILWAWRRLNANYWFYPALFAIMGGALAFGCVYLDRAGFAEWLNDVEWLAPARPQSANNMLQVIATSMIAVASTVFSITIVAVSFASGNYGPRLLTNFMEDKGNQFSLATFIGTFVYAITVLRSVRAEDESPASGVDAAATALPGFVPQLSLLVAYVLIAVSVGVLVFFLNHVPSNMRINTVIKDIGQRLLKSIEDTYPLEGNGEESHQRPTGEGLIATKPGYVQLIDFEDLARHARDADVQVTLLVRTGDFAHSGLPLAQICGDSADEDLHGKLLACFTQGASRTPEQDPQFLIDELVEIGLRALSPGINDPFTAITAMHWLGAATASLGCRRLVKDLCGDSPEDCPIYPLRDDFDHFVQRGFGGLRSAVATSPIATKIMFDVLRNIAVTIDSPERRTSLLEEAEALRDQARTALQGPDLTEVDLRFAEIMVDLRSTRTPAG